MRVIGAIIAAIAILLSFASLSNGFADSQTELINNNEEIESLVNSILFETENDRISPFISTKKFYSSFESIALTNEPVVFQIVLIPDPCNSLSNTLVVPSEVDVDCLLNDFVQIEEIEPQQSYEYTPPTYSSIVKTAKAGLDPKTETDTDATNSLEEQIVEVDAILNRVFESEKNAVNDIETNENELTEIRKAFQNIKNEWKKQVEILQNDASSLEKEEPGIKSRILAQEIEKLKIKFELREKEIQNDDVVDKKIKTSIELKIIKKKFQDSMTDYIIAEKIMRFGDDKDKKLEHLTHTSKKFLKELLIAEELHNGIEFDFDDFIENENEKDEKASKHRGIVDKNFVGDDNQVVGNGIDSTKSDNTQNDDKYTKSGKDPKPDKDSGDDDDDDD